jgi:hypothetical protein
MVIIKPNDESTYADFVKIMDEMKINQVERYALVDITPLENNLILATEGEPTIPIPASAPAGKK